MKISELQNELKTMLEQYGDLNVYTFDFRDDVGEYYEPEYRHFNIINLVGSKAVAFE